MPIYEYRCPGCGSEFEELVQSFLQADTVACPQCGRERAERRVSRVAVRVSGGGRAESCGTGGGSGGGA